MSNTAGPSPKVREGAYCVVVSGAHAGQSGVVLDRKTSKPGHITVTVQQNDGVKFKTLAKNVVVRPRESRRMVAIPATVQRKSGAFVHVEVVNLSEHGCRVRYKKTLWIGELVELRMSDRPPMRAQVRWSFLGNAGLKILRDRHSERQRPR